MIFFPPFTLIFPPPPPPRILVFSFPFLFPFSLFSYCFPSNLAIFSSLVDLTPGLKLVCVVTVRSVCKLTGQLQTPLMDCTQCTHCTLRCQKKTFFKSLILYVNGYSRKKSGIYLGEYQVSVTDVISKCCVHTY